MESAFLPPVWPRFESMTRCDKWVEFVVGCCLAPRVFLWILQFSSLLKNHHPNSYLIWIQWMKILSMLCATANPIYSVSQSVIYLFCFASLMEVATLDYKRNQIKLIPPKILTVTGSQEHRKKAEEEDHKIMR